MANNDESIIVTCFFIRPDPPGGRQTILAREMPPRGEEGIRGHLMANDLQLSYV
jgi:hypothetical protein